MRSGGWDRLWLLSNRVEYRMSDVLKQPLVQTDCLSVTFQAGGMPIKAVRDVSFEIRDHEIVALVGESGSGKSTAGLSLLGLLPPGLGTILGSARIRRKDGKLFELVGAPDKAMQAVRGNDVAMVFQEPMSSLNPVYRIGDQISESLRVHSKISRREADVEALRLLELLSIPSPEKCLASYPHQLSGGMRQRVMIAMALSGRPSLLIADEPTTALDVTIQAQIVDLLKAIQSETGMAILFITHDLGLVGDIATRMMVMYAGQIVEEGTVDQVFTKPLMPYTKALFASRPQLGAKKKTRLNPVSGTVPNLAKLPKGCSFHPRCEFAKPGLCDQKSPELENISEQRGVRCFLWREIAELS